MRSRTALGRVTRVTRVLAALVLAATGLLGAATAPAPARAATPDLTLVTAATYDVRPEERRVAVAVDVTATNHLHDSVTRKFYFDAAYLAVMPGTSGFKVSATGSSPSVAVAARKADYTLLKISFGTHLGSGKSLGLHLTFDIKDPGGAPDRPVRISPSLVSFYAWAFASASTPGSSITLQVPAGYTVTIERGPLDGPTTDDLGRQVWTSGRLDTPLSFVADVSADKPGGYVETTRSVRVGSASAAVTLSAWPDDAEWGKRVGDLFATGLPELSAQIGLDWPLTTPLDVEEVLTRTTGGYAGLFDPSTGRIQVAYSADAIVVLHEAAHTWFNGRLVADRWAAEAFASYYAAVAAEGLRLKGRSPVLTDEMRAAAFPLNAWGAVGTTSGPAEAYAYAASLELARVVAARAGPGGLASVWKAAAARVGAYQPATGETELLSGAPDWRALLDLLEDRTEAGYDDIWRAWVVRPADLPLLSARAASRRTYADLVAEAGTWQLPRSIRDEMRTWQFGAADRAMASASAVLARRADLERAAAAAGLTLPPTLRSVFQGEDGLAAAAAEADAESATIDALVAAGRARPETSGPVEALGLLGAEPEADLAAARESFASGHLSAAINDASRAETAWRTASDVGRGRLISLAFLLVAVVLFSYLVRQRRRRKRGWTA